MIEVSIHPAPTVEEDPTHDDRPPSVCTIRWGSEDEEMIAFRVADLATRRDDRRDDRRPPPSRDDGKSR